MSVICVKDLHKSFGRLQVLRGVDFTIDRPMIMGLVGPNGSGKSTLLNIMMNLLRPDRGTVHILGKTPSDITMFSQVSFLKDNSILYPYLSGADHLYYAARVYGLPKKRVDEVVQQLRLGDYIAKKSGSYSLGMKQHLLLALTLLNDPDVYILDEPLTGLDPTSILMVRELLLRLKDRGKTVFLSSHTLSEIDELTSDILFLKGGTVRHEKIAAGKSEDRYIELYADML